MINTQYFEYPIYTCNSMPHEHEACSTAWVFFFRFSAGVALSTPCVVSFRELGITVVFQRCVTPFRLAFLPTWTFSSSPRTNVLSVTPTAHLDQRQGTLSNVTNC